MSVLMTKAIQTNVIAYMRQCKLGEDIIAKFMSFIKNEDMWQKKSYQQLFDYIDDLYICDICENVEHEEFMHDTEAIVNGGVGYICESCMRDRW